MGENLFIILLITLVIFIYKLIYEPFQTIAVIADYDQKKYNVQDDFHNPEEAANHMANLRHRIESFLSHLQNNHPEDERVGRLVDRFNPENLQEAEDEHGSTSFTINKGEEVHLCLRDKDNKRDLHDLNLLTFVVIHELAHIMSLTIGHNDEFKKNFTFLLENARDSNVYFPVDYQENPINYCGLEVKNNPMF